LNGVHTFIHRYDFGSQFVAEHKWTVWNKRRTVTVFIVVKVRTANSNAAVAQQDHARVQFRPKMSLDPYILCAVEHSGFHIQAHSSSPRSDRRDYPKPGDMPPVQSLMDEPAWSAK
jgi:hypothetical protein